MMKSKSMTSKGWYRGFIGMAVFCMISCSGSTQPSSLSGVEALCARGIAFSDASDLDPLIALCRGSRLVLLGESTHGTAEYYRWRAEISKRLIMEKGFRFIAVEGDWMPIYRLNMYVKGLDDVDTATAADILRKFSRWPEWMWGNTEVAELAEWMRAYNADLPVVERVGFYGMDVYGQWEAMDEVFSVSAIYLPDHAEEIRTLYSCFTAFGRDEWRYAQAVMQGLASCNDNLYRVVEIFRRRLSEVECPEEYKMLFHGVQSAKVVKNAEEFFRLAVRGDNRGSWNSRVDHMHRTVQRLLDQYGNDAAGIVWAHNTHIGDARATTMASDGQKNIGQLSRELFGDTAVTSIGFTTYTGRVNAGSRWGSPMSIMDIPSPPEGSLEYLLNSCGLKQFFVVFDRHLRSDSLLNSYLGHRAIGVVYNPSTERRSNYVPTIVPSRYDAMVFFHTTRELMPVR